jgi:hypothetical protein
MPPIPPEELELALAVDAALDALVDPASLLLDATSLLLVAALLLATLIGAKKSITAGVVPPTGITAMFVDVMALPSLSRSMASRSGVPSASTVKDPKVMPPAVQSSVSSRCSDGSTVPLKLM